MSDENFDLGKIDPITFEILRHRLWAINDEQGMVAARTSGSPVIYETFDFNIGLLTADGKGVFIGVYIAHHAIPLEQAVKSVKDRFGEDISAGDMFFTNDPWYGALHANDGLLVSPVFWEGEIVCWTAIAMHDSDVGGPVAGSFAVGAKETFGEAPLYPPIRLVKGDMIQEDIYSVLRRNCRTPEMNYLNMRARIGSQLTARRRIHDLIEEYSKGTITTVLDQITKYTNTLLKTRLNEIPDGSWWEYGYLDHDGITNRIYRLVLKLTKNGTRLTFDFSGTDPQAVGSVNCTSSGLLGGVVAPLFAMLCHDLPWSTGALEDIVEIKTDEGTINNAMFPAGVSMASIQGTWATQDVASNAIAKMLCCSSTYKEEATACWQPYWNGIVLSGMNSEEQFFLGPLLDPGAGGSGARTFCDGIDSGGQTQSLSIAIPNVETNEFVYPILEIYRQHCPDTCGHGMYRGGVGIEYAFTPLNVPEAIMDIIFTSAVSMPDARGLFGGYPGSVNANVVLRKSNISELFHNGSIPRNMKDIQATKREIMPAKAVTHLALDDVHISILAGGGGYGDPIRRDAELVCQDVANYLISREVAQRVYGVVFKDGKMTVDYEETKILRERMLSERKAMGTVRAKTAVLDRLKSGNIDGKALSFRYKISDFLEVRTTEGMPGIHIICCSSCNEPLCSTNENLRDHTKRLRSSKWDSLCSVYGLLANSLFSLIEYSCPSCGALLSIDVVPNDEAETTRTEFLIAST